MRTGTTKADFYRSQIASYEDDISTAGQYRREDRVPFLRREIVITKMLLDTTLAYGDNFATGAGKKELEAANQAAAKVRGIFKSALGAAYYHALRKSWLDDVGKARDPRDPVEFAAAIVANLKRAPSEARAVGTAARDAILKAKQADLNDQRDAASIRASLRAAAALRKNANWLEIPPADRRRIDETVQAARQHLAKLDARKIAREAVNQDASKYRQAMIERGVTFNRMTQY